MARPYSQDLRDRVIEATGNGTSARQAAARFDVGVSTATKWVERLRDSGDRSVLSGPAPASIARAGMRLIRGHAASMMASTVAVLRRWTNLRQPAGTYWLRRERGRRKLRSSSYARQNRAAD